MQWVNEAGFKQLLVHAVQNSHSSFFRDKYAAGTALFESNASPAQMLSMLPFLTREELQNTPLAQRLFVPPEEVRFVAFTSGTSSKRPLMVPFADVKDYFFEPSLGLPVSRVLVIHPPMMKSFAHTFVQQCRQAQHPVQLLFGDVQSMANSVLLADEFMCDAVYATPTVAAAFAQHALARPGTAQRIQLLVLTSETLSASRRQEFSRMFPRAHIANVYGSTELGQLPFFPCQRIMERGESYFHILTEALASVELVEGELVISYGLNRATPLVRYRTGDFMEEVQEGCACGLPGPVLAWTHRGEVDRVRVGGVEFQVSESDDAFARLTYLTFPSYQVHFHPGAQEGGAIRLEVEVRDPVLANTPVGETLAVRIENDLPDAWRIASRATLRTALGEGLLSSLSVRVVREFSSALGTKAKRFVNHIQ